MQYSTNVVSYIKDPITGELKIRDKEVSPSTCIERETTEGEPFNVTIHLYN
jgi:hypothetical protein